MDYNEALELLDIDDNYNEKILRKCYLKKALIHHPDKVNNKDNGEEFKKIKQAYDILYERLHIKTKINQENDYTNILKNYISIISEKYNWNDALLYNSIISIITKTKKISLRLFEALNKEHCLELFELVNKYKKIFNIDESLIQDMSQIIKRKYNELQVITLNPSLNDLFENNIYALENNNEKYYIPLWHNEVYFDNLIVLINPELPEHINIDEENNIHIHININNNDLIHKNIFKINITENMEIELNTNKLFCKKYQKHIIYNKGISKINEKNLFDISKKSDIIIHINAV
jgi:curved DNA-binding protein CbpA